MNEKNNEWRPGCMNEWTASQDLQRQPWSLTSFALFVPMVFYGPWEGRQNDVHLHTIHTPDITYDESEEHAEMHYGDLVDIWEIRTDHGDLE